MSDSTYLRGNVCLLQTLSQKVARMYAVDIVSSWVMRNEFYGLAACPKFQSALWRILLCIFPLLQLFRILFVDHLYECTMTIAAFTFLCKTRRGSQNLAIFPWYATTLISFCTYHSYQTRCTRSSMAACSLKRSVMLPSETFQIRIYFPIPSLPEPRQNVEAFSNDYELFMEAYITKSFCKNEVKIVGTSLGSKHIVSSYYLYTSIQSNVENNSCQGYPY
jgi:hypothetical protein